MAKVQDVLDIMAMPRITMEQVKVLQNFHTALHLQEC